VPKRRPKSSDPQLDALLQRSEDAKRTMAALAKTMQQLVKDVEEQRRQNEEIARRQRRP
jgi:uncharacterized protein YoxC